MSKGPRDLNCGLCRNFSEKSKNKITLRDLLKNTDDTFSHVLDLVIWEKEYNKSLADKLLMSSAQ